MSQKVAEIYDAIAYQGEPVSRTRPDELSVIGFLMGMSPTRADNCQFLELGAANGSNLIPLAAAHPQSKFVGIDISPKQVADGNRSIIELGLKNIELKVADVSNSKSITGTFDYILGHGLFSWVSPTVQAGIFALCQEKLAPQGIVYLSYNTLPGWRLRGTVRDLMFYEIGAEQDPQIRAQAGRSAAKLVSAMLEKDYGARPPGMRPPTAGGFGLALKAELDLARGMPDWYLTHDFLSDDNNALYFYQFMELAQRHGLQYLGDAEVSSMLPQDLTPQAQQLLRGLEREPLKLEQYTDFVRNRLFRRSLLVRSDLVLSRRVDATKVRSFYIASPLKFEGDPRALQDVNPILFRHPAGGAMNVAEPLIKAAMHVLSQHWPASIHFDQLLDSALSLFAQAPAKATPEFEAAANALATALYKPYFADLLEFQRHPVPIAATVTEKPRAATYARILAQRVPRVANLRHQLVALSEDQKRIVSMLDGTKNRAAILESMPLQTEEGIARILEELRLEALLEA